VHCPDNEYCTEVATSKCADDFYSCEICAVDGDCDHITDLPACHAEGCVECTDSDLHCTEPGLYACNTFNSTCVECYDNTDTCEDGFNVCLDDTCFQCDTSKDDCGDEKFNVCEANMCLECVDVGDCLNGATVCTDNLCLECAVDGDCDDGFTCLTDNTCKKFEKAIRNCDYIKDKLLSMYEALGHPDSMLLAETSAWGNLEFKQRQCTNFEKKMERSARKFKRVISKTKKKEKNFQSAMQKLFSALKRVSRHAARKLKDPDTVSSDDYYYLNVLHILAK